ncbi:succinate dehydrogenase assembly factor 4, mitochondrial-like [Phalaenopsis equestris]|uniref:succinate dehydrogenase assembly factor 4, mitochondrial-like n=1 Tax=Phalaenopsis equestris TaxID=78828 RepID=UPI0009E3D70B|nr:succinate dehydrogenase assembly factor 4, mitochondrial-like [Phalaenopsis equestris]
MANKFLRLVPLLRETSLGVPRTPTLSITVLKRAFSSTSRPDSKAEIANEHSSLPPDQPNKDRRTLIDRTSPAKEEEEEEEEDEEEEEEEEDEEDSVYVNKETGEISGPKGPEPTRYGDWERNGRCSDF